MPEPAKKKPTPGGSSPRRASATKKAPAKKAAGSSPRATRKAAKKSVSPARLWAGRILRGGIIALILALVVGTAGGAVAYSQTRLPDPNAAFQANTSFVYWRDGQTKMGNCSVQNRQSRDYDKMPQAMKDAAVAAENRTFWTDRGISITGMVRAAWTIVRGGDMQGGVQGRKAAWRGAEVCVGPDLTRVDVLNVMAPERVGQVRRAAHLAPAQHPSLAQQQQAAAACASGQGGMG